MLKFLLSDTFITFVLIPFLILVARVVDVSLGTIRLIFISKGEKLISALIGFFEVLIWLLAITRIFENLNNIFAYFAYAGGFSIGTYLGIVFEKKLLVGKVMVRFTTEKDSKTIIKELKRKKYTFTCVGVDGPDGKVKPLHVIIHKKDLNKLIDYIIKHDKKAFYTVEEVKIVSENNNNHNFKIKKSERVLKAPEKKK